MPFLIVDHISKTYDKANFPALYPIQFSMTSGEVLTILGESGSGKSTLLKLLAGLLDADTGSIHLADQAIKGPSHKLVPGYDQIKVVNQGFLLSPNMRVWENLRYHLLRFPRAAQEKRIEELTELCRLEGLTEKYPRELSGGQQQRVAIGRAIANHPKLLLLDEPFSNLDAILKNQLIDELTGIIRRSGTTAIFVMHNPYDALRISDRIGVIKDGRLIQLAAPIEIYDAPQTPYVAKLFGHPTILSGELLHPFHPPHNFPTSSTICIREHAIQLNSAGNHSIEAQIINRQFQGDHWKIILKVARDLTFHANIPRDCSLQVGNQIK
ncbi:MAG: ABC transporter ATP-binding protein, partial [Flammeovirgaceae bacterium]